ncbi:MAG: MFS transporter [Candidatus Eremiobacteraeota bacterium]|nr:MFS transporter [Candidatus Eremiobacteraeota bacterium]
MNALWVGIHFQDTALVAIVVPAIVLRLAPHDHTAVLAMLATFVYVAVAVVPPVAGWLSDRARRRGGDRRRETALALLVDVLAIGAMAFAASVGAVGAALVAATIAITAAQTIYQALLPEVVPRAAWGTSSGARGVMTLAGTVLGLLAAALLPPQLALFAMVAVMVVAALSLAAIPAPAAGAPTPHATIRDRHDLTVTLFARGWIVLGMTLLNTYVLYFFNDVLGARDASLKTGLVAGSALVGAIVSSVLAGKLSDRFDRRWVVALSGVPMTLAATGFALVPEPQLIFVYAGLFGLGFGGVFAVGWALALDTIPELGDVARDLGVWGTLSNLPSIAAPAIGGWIIVHGATPADGYRWLFASAGLCFAIGSLVVLRVGHEPLASSWSTLLVALTCAIRQPLIACNVRVRQWGRLPRRRGPALLIANHQHEDESEIVVERTFLQGPWRPAFTASSRRMYEPGFFATRMPWLAPLMRGVNAGPLFVALGMLPLENELAVRPLRSLAYAVHARHGDLPLDVVFRDDARAPVPGAQRLSDLLAPAAFAAGETRVRVSYVREPYRGELLAQTRAGIAEDIARIAGVVLRGATFFVTPEGFYSTDGRMRPLKGIVEHLVPLARVWFAAIAFDPFRGRRLSLLYRVVEPADPHDLATSLAAARPVTTSALLAQWLLAVGLPFSDDEARDGVVRLRDALPRGAFVDPELARDPQACVDEALARMTRRALLVADGGRRRLAERRGDARFPGVEDIVAYQAAFQGETVDALRRLAERPPPGLRIEPS